MNLATKVLIGGVCTAIAGKIFYEGYKMHRGIKELFKYYVLRAHIEGKDGKGTILVCDHLKEVLESDGITPNSQFYIGSITKPITAFMFLKTLQEMHEGQDLNLLLNKPLSELFGDSEFLKQIDNDWISKVSVLDLCTHKSGLSNYLNYTDDAPETDNYSEYSKPLDPSLLLQNVYFSEDNHGHINDYNHSDYFILGKLLEEMHGESYDKIFDKMIAKPLGMTNSHAPVEGNYSSFKDQDKYSKLVENNSEQNVVDMANLLGVGNIISTSEDLSKWSNYFFKSEDQSVIDIRDIMLDEYGQDAYGDIEHIGFITEKEAISSKDIISNHDDYAIGGYYASLSYCPSDEKTTVLLSNDSATYYKVVDALYDIA